MNNPTPKKWQFYFNSYDPNNVQVFDIYSKHVAWVNNETNARLIAAAPELLEAANAVWQRMMPALNFDTEGWPELDTLKKIIDKAEGK